MTLFLLICCYLLFLKHFFQVAVKAKEEVLRSVESYLTVDLETVKDQLVDLEDEAGKVCCKILFDIPEYRFFIFVLRSARVQSHCT